MKYWIFSYEISPFIIFLVKLFNCNYWWMLSIKAPLLHFVYKTISGNAKLYSQVIIFLHLSTPYVIRFSRLWKNLILLALQFLQCPTQLLKVCAQPPTHNLRKPKDEIFFLKEPEDEVLILVLSRCVTAECTPDDVFKHVGENAIFASGSPFGNVSLGNSFLLSFALFYSNNL